MGKYCDVFYLKNIMRFWPLHSIFDRWNLNLNFWPLIYIVIDFPISLNRLENINEILIEYFTRFSVCIFCDKNQNVAPISAWSFWFFGVFFPDLCNCILEICKPNLLQYSNTQKYPYYIFYPIFLSSQS